MESSASILLMLPSGEYVLQRRTDDAPASPGKLGLFGGGIEPGESPYQCIQRELGEETSLEVGRLIIDFLTCYEWPGWGGCTYFFHTVIPSPEFEVYEGKWAEVHTREALRARSDLTRSLQHAMSKLLI